MVSRETVMLRRRMEKEVLQYHLVLSTKFMIKVVNVKSSLFKSDASSATEPFRMSALCSDEGLTF